MRYLLIAMSALLAGCGPTVEDLLDSLTGSHTQRVILAEVALVVDPAGIKLRSAEPLQVLGEQAQVCLTLKGGVPLDHQPKMEAAFNKALGGATLSGSLTLDNGQTFPVSGAGQAWSKYGRVTSGDEIAACLSCNCGPKPPIGSVVSEVEVHSSIPLRVLGIYWESTNAFDTPVATAKR